jgi:hypothetical protein
MKVTVAQLLSKCFLSPLKEPTVLGRVRKRPPSNPILGQINPVHTFRHYFSIILPSSIPRSSKWPLHFRFSDQHFYAFLIISMLVTCPALIISVFLNVEQKVLWRTNGLLSIDMARKTKKLVGPGTHRRTNRSLPSKDCGDTQTARRSHEHH